MLTRKDLSMCDRKSDVYCAILRDVKYKDNPVDLNIVIGTIERELSHLNINEHKININDVKHAVNICICEQKWKTFHADKYAPNDIKSKAPGICSEKDYFNYGAQA